MTNQEVVSFDLDSCVANTEHRAHMIVDRSKMKPEDWTAYSMACVDDTDGPAMPLLRYIDDWSPMPWIVVSRRENAAREFTVKWFEDRNLYPEAMLLLMDEFSSDIRTQPEWKVRAIEDYEKRTGNRVVMHVDDNPAVIKACIDAGIPALQVVPDYEAEFQKGL